MDEGRIELVIVGHLGHSQDRTPYGVRTGPGGAGYACARGATVIDPGRVGLVAAVGKDYDFTPIRALGVDVCGVRVRNGDTPRFAMVQHANGLRSPHVVLGTAGVAAVDCFPATYAKARHVHLATAPPEQQLEWLRFLRACPDPPAISIDTFETYAVADGDRSREVCRAADLVFMNEEERRVLFGSVLPPSPQVVTKLGPAGASYASPAGTWHVATEPVDPLDTTGAGEVLAGVFLALRTAGYPPQSALRPAVRAATAKVTEFGVDGVRLQRVLADTRTRAAAAPSMPGVEEE